MIKVTIVAVIGLAVYVLFRVTRLALARSESLRLRNGLTYIVPVEILVWTAYFFRSFEYLFAAASYYDYMRATLILIGFGLLVWFYLKEVVAGAFFRLQHNPKAGRQLQTDDLEGIVKRISATHIYLDTPGGKVVRLPYSKLVGSVFSLSTHKEAAHAFKFSIRVEKKWTGDETLQRIRRALLLSPYCSYKEPVDITIEDESPSSYVCNIAVRTIGHRFGTRVEKDLADALNAPYNARA